MSNYDNLNEDARRILGSLADRTEEGLTSDGLVQEWANEFYHKAREYGTMHRVLGIRAQFVDIHRKVGKLERAWWQDADTLDWREQPREIAMDLIGHLFLAIAMIDREYEGFQEAIQRTSRQEQNKHVGYGMGGNAVYVDPASGKLVQPGVDHGETFLAQMSLGTPTVPAPCNDNSDDAEVFCKRGMGHDGWHSGKFNGINKSWAPRDAAKAEPAPLPDACGEPYSAGTLHGEVVTCDLVAGHRGRTHSGWNGREHERLTWFG